ncbi:unnamed protein product [Blepharisma stoltei]|uniref:Uncharacterized protein n=1 Tax=Blepharisma stoltei TaxID=1481888 RepID=A0AAU9IDS8_9CILI|nr:unnamed protein product [Blepharisma stoltei]
MMVETKKMIESTVSKPDFDLRASIEDVIQEMIKAKDENPELIIPDKFLECYNSKEMLGFIACTYNYSAALFSIENRIEQQKSESKGKLSKKFSYTRNDGFLLESAAQEVAQSYGKLILNQWNFRQNYQSEQNFFETLIYFVVRVLKPAYSKNEIRILEEELNRLFRSTAFNISKRKHQQEDRFKRFPKLNVCKSKDQETIIRHIEYRNKVTRERLKKEKSSSCDMRPGYVKLSPYRALTARSPLIALLFPAPCDRVRIFEEKRKRRRLSMDLEVMK